MKEKLNACLRPSRKWTDQFVVAAVLMVALNLVGGILFDLIYRLIPIEKLFRLLTSSDGVVEHLYFYFAFFGIWIVFFLVCAAFKRNRPILRQLLPNNNGNNLRGVLAGLLLGFGTNGFCVLLSVGLGDIHLSFHEFNPLLFFTFLFVVLIQSGAEEILDRVYLYQKLRRRYRHPAVAIVGNALIFGVLHLLNPGVSALPVIELVLTGVVFSLLVYYYDSPWAAIMFHTAWNFTQSIVFGLPNSGNVSAYSLFKLEAASARNGLFYTVDFGVEGSIGSTAILTLLMVVLILINRGKPERNDAWGENVPCEAPESADAV